jgi:hypothetical protein
VHVPEMHDAVGAAGPLPQAVKVLEFPPYDLGTGLLEHGGRCIRPSKGHEVRAGPDRSGTTAEPMKPDPPVMKRRMAQTSR